MTDSSNLSNVKVLEYYGATDPPEGPGWKSMLCCFHEEHRPSARSNGSGFMCMGCGVKGSPLSLIMEREGIDFKSALSKYEEIVGEELTELRSKSSKRFRPFEDSSTVSNEPRDFERNGSLFSLGSSRKPRSRIRPRFYDR